MTATHWYWYYNDHCSTALTHHIEGGARWLVDKTIGRLCRVQTRLCLVLLDSSYFRFVEVPTSSHSSTVVHYQLGGGEFPYFGWSTRLCADLDYQVHVSGRFFVWGNTKPPCSWQNQHEGHSKSCAKTMGGKGAEHLSRESTFLTRRGWSK